MKIEYQVYVLENAQGRRYIGISEDVTTRLEQHNNGVSKWTAKYGPWHLIWESEKMDHSSARKLESLLKRQKGGAGLNRLMEHHGRSSGS